MTQRLISQVVLALVRWLDAPPADEQEPSRSLTIQKWEQAAALAQYMPPAVVQPLAAPAPTREGLVTSIDLQHASANFAITFHLGPDVGVTSHFNAVEVRQWLSMLYGLYQTADWPLANWPTWFEKPLEAATPSLIN